MKLGDLFIKLGLQKGDFDKGIDDAKRKTSAFGESMKKIGGMIAGVFAVGAITNYLREASKVAAETENVRTAFIRLGGGAYFNDLNNAVRGTLSQVDLMKNTIQATNFGIPIKDLANLFKFATERASQTGQSVEYLTQSIVMGIGRKSVLILDNLGISAVQLREKLKKVGEEAATVGDVSEAIGSIAQEQFKRMGEQANTTAQKLDDVKGSWNDIKVAIGDAINQNDLFIGGIKLLNNYLNVFSKQAENAMTNASSRVKKFMGTMPESIADQKEKIKAEIERINQEISSIEGKQSSFDWLTIGTKRAHDERKQEINTLKNQAIELAGIFDALKIKEEPRTVLQRISDLEFLISMEKKLASQKNISSEDAIAHSNAIKKAEEELKQLREIAGIAAQKTYKQQLDDIIAINKALEDEKEAQRILRMDFYGEKVAPITPIGTPSQLQSTPIDTSSLADMSNYLKSVSEKREKWTEEEKKSWQDFNDELNQIIESGISDAIGTMAAGFGEMLAMNDWDWSDFGSKILDSIGKFMQQFGAAMVAMGIAQLQLNLGMTTLNPALLIGGGAALIAAGAALSSLASQGMKGSKSSATSPASGYSNYSQSNAAAVISGNVVFELEGTKLRGALNNSDRKNRYIR